MITRIFGDICFQRVVDVQLETDSAGRVVEYTPAMPVEAPLNRHAAGPFCRFRIGQLPASSGVYAIVVDEDLKYIGCCVDLARRFGSGGYGVIHERNLHSDGQSANCKINSRVLSETKAGRAITVFFHESEDRYREIEAKLISILVPPWNDRRESVIRSRGPREKVGKSPYGHRSVVNRESFAAALKTEFITGSALGHSSVRVRAGDLHTKVGGYPGPDNRMPTCCSVMRDAMGHQDRIIDAPPSGKGARLTIEYWLPRPVL
jgi:5-methylcytosine-specific restriction protein A